MARIKFPHKSSALTASFSVRQPPNASFALSGPPTVLHLLCGYYKICNIQINFAIPPFSHFSRWLWEFFTPYQSCEISIASSINLLGILKPFLAFSDSPYFMYKASEVMIMLMPRCLIVAYALLWHSTLFSGISYICYRQRLYSPSSIIIIIILLSIAFSVSEQSWSRFQPDCHYIWSLYTRLGISAHHLATMRMR